MSDKRTYKEIAATIETHVIYINNHLENIDSHLDRQNGKVEDAAIAIAVNKSSIKRLWWFVGGAVTIILSMLGIVISVGVF